MVARELRTVRKKGKGVAMRNVLTYSGIFVVSAVLLHLFFFDSMRLGVLFGPLAYVGFVILLPLRARVLGVLLLAFLVGAFVDFFEGTMGLHSAAITITAYLRRPVMNLALGKETVEDAVGMPSGKSLGGGRFFRYSAAVVFLHSFVFFNLEALSLENYWLGLAKTGGSGVVTLFAVWITSLVFSIGSRKKR